MSANNRTIYSKKDMKLTPIYFLLLFFVLQGCFIQEPNPDNENFARNNREIQEYIQRNNLTNIKSTGSGLFYQITRSSNKDTTQAGDSLTLHFVARLLSGTIVDSTSELRNRPDSILYLGPNSRTIAGLEEGLKLLREGENATFFIPSNLAFGSSSFYTFGQTTVLIPPYSVLKYDVKLVNVNTEAERILKYAAKKNIQPVVTDSGLYTYVVKAGTGLQAASGDSLILDYEGKLLNDEVFDAGPTSDSTVFRLGFSSLIKGFEEGLGLMRAGETRILLIPSGLGYGREGTRDAANRVIIPAYSPLVFTVTLKTVKKTP